MEVNIKRLKDKSVLPVKAHKSDACFDLTCESITTEIGEDGQLVIVYHSGIAIELPDNYTALVFPRSSLSKKSMFLTNGVGVIDSGYRGEILAKFKTNTNVVPAVYKEGERFAQLIILPYPSIDFNEVSELSESDRNDGGFGSTGDDNKTTAEEQKNTTDTVTTDEDVAVTTSTEDSK